MNGILDLLASRGYRGSIIENEPLSGHCSLGVGGPASLFAMPGDLADLHLLLETLDREGVSRLILGGGTNMFFSGGGFKGCVIRLGEGFGSMKREGEDQLIAGAACGTGQVLTSLVRDGLTGFEFAAGIPGTIGGAARMNAGTGEGDMSSVVESLQLVTGGETRWQEKDRLGFRYRGLSLPPDAVITAVRLRLQLGDRQRAAERMNAVLTRRRRTQPLTVPSAGCWFLNPPGDSAGRLIDAAGLKGERIGGARVSDIHANFLVNSGGATAEDFNALAALVRDRVQERFGITLEEEVQVVEG